MLFRSLIIAPILGYSILGNYHLGLQFLSLLQILPSIAYKYFLPHDAAGTSNKNLKKATMFVAIFLTIIGFIAVPILAPITFPKFTAVKEIIQIISLAIIPYSISMIYESKFLGMEKSRIVLTGSLIFLFTEILFIITLGRLLGINGVAIALVLSYVAQCLYYLAANFLKIK